MPLSKIDDFRSLSEAELNEQISSVKRDLFELRLQQVTRSTDARPKPHQYKHLKHKLAQLMTLERERQITASTTGTVVTGDATPSALASEEE
ncbi:50S ribosomal protein L29 [Trichothermofontia sp.]